jgi:outer membrane lipoprotein-sorting protein
MIKLKILLLASSIIILSVSHFAQSKNPDTILENVKRKFQEVNDYQVDVKVKVDVNFLKVPETEAKIYFKQPDKIHFESKNFALLPKEGLNFSPMAFLKNDYTAIYEKDELLNGVNASIVKIIPGGESSNLILSTLWIDQKNNVIRKVQSTTKNSGTFTIEMNYDQIIKYPLPSSMIFSFNVEKMNLPRTFDSDPKRKSTLEDKGKTTTGKVYITYSNYLINKGIPDSVFEQKEK